MSLTRWHWRVFPCSTIQSFLVCRRVRKRRNANFHLPTTYVEVNWTLLVKNEWLRLSTKETSFLQTNFNLKFKFTSSYLDRYRTFCCFFLRMQILDNLSKKTTHSDPYTLPLFGAMPIELAFLQAAVGNITNALKKSARPLSMSSLCILSCLLFHTHPSDF